MEFLQIQEKLVQLVNEASKILKLDDSLSSLRERLQKAIAASYRIANPMADYYNYPYIEDIFGDTSSGQVVYSKSGVFTMANYKAVADTFTLTGEKAVKRSYVAEAEAATTQESDYTEDAGSIIEIQEAKKKDGSALMPVKIIAPGTGSMGHYTVEALKQAAKDKVFPKGTQMFIDHQTAEERKARPEGSVSRLAAVLESDAEYQENGKEGPGLYAVSRVYKDFKGFIQERIKDIGLSIRAAVIPSRTKTVAGVPVVERMVKSLSVDFVTKAGAGGKLMEMYESYREKTPGTERQSAAENNRSEGMEINEKELKTLQEAAAQVPVLTAKVDRLLESNQRLQAQGIVDEALRDSGLSARGQSRVRLLVLPATATVPLKDGALDVAAIQEATKNAIKEEKDYLHESGATTKTVTGNGAGTQNNQESEDKLLQESGKALDDSVALLTGSKGDK